MRRTDYLHHPAFQVFGEDYHRRAMDEMRNRIEEPKFYIFFSDDPEWCRVTFTDAIRKLSMVGRDPQTHYTTFALMTLASHHITVNDLLLVGGLAGREARPAC